MPKSTATLPDWDRALSSAARLQRIVLTDLRQRFDEVLAELESVAGWKTARIQRPIQILGSLDGIETGVRQLIRKEPLETAVVACLGARITVPTPGEILRIKGVLILKRNATQDYMDFVALAPLYRDLVLFRWIKRIGAMADDIENLIQEHLKAIRAGMAAAHDNLRDITHSTGRVELAMPGLRRDMAHLDESRTEIRVRMNRLNDRIERIERQLGILP